MGYADGQRDWRTMSTVQVTIAGPGKRQKVWRLPLSRPLETFLSQVVERMGLPTHLNWQLMAPSGEPLGKRDTLAQARVKPGQTLRLQSLQDWLLKEFLDQLYDQAQEYVQDQLWDKALEKLEELHEYDPRYPDPRGLQQLAQAGIAPSAIPAAGISWGLVGAAIGAVVVATGIGALGLTAAVGGGVWLATRMSESGGTATPAADRVVPHTGDVQVTLEWDTTADLDLHVFDPAGEEVYFGHRQAASGGELDVDANFPCTAATTQPVENVYWPWGGAPPGEYRVRVKYFGQCQRGRVPRSIGSRSGWTARSLRPTLAVWLRGKRYWSPSSCGGDPVARPQRSCLISAAPA